MSAVVRTQEAIFQRNAHMAIDVFVHRLDLTSAQRKYRITLSTQLAILHHLAYCTLGQDHDSLARIRQEVRRRLQAECLGSGRKRETHNARLNRPGEAGSG